MNNARSVIVGVGLLVGSVAEAGSVSSQFGTQIFGLPWNASKAVIEERYPGGEWTESEDGPRYCAATRQTLLRLPEPHLTRELCMSVDEQGRLHTVTARLPATLPSLLAIVNRSRTTFGDFDAVQRDQGSVQSKSTAMFWSKDSPLVVVVKSQNDDNGAPQDVTFIVTSDGAAYLAGTAKVSNVPAGLN